MLQVTSPACSTATRDRAASRGVRTLVAAAVSLALACAGAATAQADPLTDRQAEVQRSVQDAREQVSQATTALEQAEAALQASQQQLDGARAALEATRAELTEAKRVDAELAARLAHEQRLLREAQRATAKARAEVEAQREMIAEAARDSFRTRADLGGIGVVLGSKSPTEMGQRLQWDTTIFNTTGQRMDELEVLEQRLERAEAEQAEVEARVAEDKAAAADNVRRVARLEADAVSQADDVAALVAENERLRTDAQAVLDADTREYEALLAEEAKVQGEIAARVARELTNGAPREDIAKLVAAGVVSTDPATYPMAETGAQMILSPQGFIRPLKARPGSPFGKRFHPILKYWRMHNGTDFGAACGLPLYAAQSGTIAQARWQGGFGNYVIVDHGNVGGSSIMTGYAHMDSMSVRAGQRVEMGQLIGYVGTTGLSTGCHLHLQVYRNGTPVNPMAYIP